MPKLAASLTLALVIGVCWWFSSLAPKRLHLHRISGDSSEQWEVIETPNGRVLNVVVDVDGVYLEKQRLEFATAAQSLNGVLRDQKIRNFKIFATPFARYGDAVQLYGSIEPGLVAWKSISLRPVPEETRLPAIGFLRRYCCGSDDVVLARFWSQHLGDRSDLAWH